MSGQGSRSYSRLAAAFVIAALIVVGTIFAASGFILIGAAFDASQDYPLTISGTLENGTRFLYAAPVQVVPLG